MVLHFNVFQNNPLSANPKNWSSTLKKFFGNLPTNCLSVFDHFGILALKRLSIPRVVVTIHLFTFLNELWSKNSLSMTETFLHCFVSVLSNIIWKLAVFAALINGEGGWENNLGI